MFAALGVPVLRGREIGHTDVELDRRPALVNESFVKKFWPGQEPLGKRIQSLDVEVVGVVKDVRYSRFVTLPKPMMFGLRWKEGLLHPHLLIRAKRDPGQLISGVRAELVRVLALSRFEPQIEQLLLDPETDLAVCGAIGQTLVALHPDDKSAALAPLVGEPSVPVELRRNVARALAEKKSSDAEALLSDAFRTLTRRFQIRLAESLAGSAGGAEHLLRLVAEGRAPAAVLLERPVKDKLLASRPATLAPMTLGVRLYHGVSSSP